MLKSVFNFIKLPIIENLRAQTLQSQLRFPNVISTASSRCLHITSSNFGKDRRTLTAGAVKKDEGVDGEGIIDIDNRINSDDIFPDASTPNLLFNGIPFKEIPIINIKCTPNNTLMSLTDYNGLVKICHSCGCEGFKHAKKGTNIAAQVTAIALSNKALSDGFKTVRVRVRGLGPGRASAIKGLQIGGMDIISITDYTKVSWNPPRPRKAKRL